MIVVGSGGKAPQVSRITARLNKLCGVENPELSTSTRPPAPSAAPKAPRKEAAQSTVSNTTSVPALLEQARGDLPDEQPPISNGQVKRSSEATEPRDAATGEEVQEAQATPPTSLPIEVPAEQRHQPVETRAARNSAHGASASAPGTGTAPDLPGLQRLMGAQHVMLSYNWSHQATVLETRTHLDTLGFSCWIDVDYMKQDIYDSMAAGVQGACCVVAFMSHAYQESANCKLELKFAQQSGKKILAVMIEPNFRQTGWLGIITAGALWIELHNPAEFTQNANKLAAAIHYALVQEHGEVVSERGMRESASGEDLEDGAFSIDEMRGELGRLAANLGDSKATAASSARATDFGSSVGSSSGFSAMRCALPAGVPALPQQIRVTTEMKQLLRNVLTFDSTVSNQQGFCGMGGIGKTIVSAWIVRQPKVREAYAHICWVPLGQQPNINKAQSLLYYQLTGMQLAHSSTVSENEELIKDGMKGKSILLVVDDCWEAAHAGSLNFLDESTHSKVLMSSRIRGTLEGGDIAQIGLPSDEEAIHMLQAAAGMTDESLGAPTEAIEVVRLCNNLPLALSIAGRLVKGMSVGSDWHGVAAVLRDEFGGDDAEASSMADKVIMASLANIPGATKQQVTHLFLAFALVPEDTFW